MASLRAACTNCQAQLQLRFRICPGVPVIDLYGRSASAQPSLTSSVRNSCACKVFSSHLTIRRPFCVLWVVCVAATALAGRVVRSGAARSRAAEARKKIGQQHCAQWLVAAAPSGRQKKRLWCDGSALNGSDSCGHGSSLECGWAVQVAAGSGSPQHERCGTAIIGDRQAHVGTESPRMRVCMHAVCAGLYLSAAATSVHG
eukprot:362860-Chlamydomonas_euryale.AAC.2